MVLGKLNIHRGKEEERRKKQKEREEGEKKGKKEREESKRKGKENEFQPNLHHAHKK